MKYKVNSTFLFFFFFLRDNVSARRLWLTPVTLATWEAEIGNLAVQGQPKQKVSKTSSQQKKLGVVVYSCHPSYHQKFKTGGLSPRPAWTKSEMLSSKLPEQKGLEAWLKQ
jgi:hypothetical protein